jgi:2-polyprenyl-3-methyl-5-hydroxy-6-metoxy-1,4-benzoquinol methylase
LIGPWCPDAGTHVECACGLAPDLPLRDEAFYVIILSDVLEHIPEPQKSMEAQFSGASWR